MCIRDRVKATVTITNPNFKGDSKVDNYDESELTAMALKDEYIKLRETKFTYTGQEIKPDFDVVIGGKVINPDYYTVSYTNNIYAGTATLTVTGNGSKYSNKKSAKVTFTIDPAKTEDLVGVLPSKQYRGYSLEVPADEIYATLNGNEIDVAKNFTLSYGENLNIGEFQDSPLYFFISYSFEYFILTFQFHFFICKQAFCFQYSLNSLRWIHCMIWQKQPFQFLWLYDLIDLHGS